MNAPDVATREAFAKMGWHPEVAEFEIARNKRTAELMAANPGMAAITAMIMAGDQVGAELTWTPEFEAKGDPNLAWLVGSYARWQWALDHSGPEWVRANLNELWTSSDPDDTDPRALAVWRDAWEANGRKPVTDYEPQPKSLRGQVAKAGTAYKPLPRSKHLVIYRGQMPFDPYGIAWSLDYKVADKFARGAGSRVPTAGAVIKAMVRRENVLGYNVGRNEAEVVVDPKDVIGGTIVTQYQLVPRAKDTE